MEKVIIKEIAISNIDEFLTVIERTLVQCIDIQIFISDILYKRLLEENKSCIIWKEDVLDSFHYCDRVEKAFILSLKYNDETKTLQMHFVKDSVNHMHMTFYASKGILYRHCLNGIKRILIINTD